MGLKEVNKISKIYQGFFGDRLPEEKHKERLDKCMECPFNSKNRENLALVDRIRKNMINEPFCTLCKCQIFEKTGSALEECAAYMANEERKWYKLKIETMGKKKINITQVGNKEFDLYLEGDYFVIDCGVVTSDFDVEFLTEAKRGVEFEAYELKPTCGCTSVKSEKIDNRHYKNSLIIKSGDMSVGSYSKVVKVVYNLDNEEDTLLQEVKIKFFRA